MINLIKKKKAEEAEKPLLKSYNETATLARVHRVSGNYKTFDVQPSNTSLEMIFLAFDKFGIQDTVTDYELVEVRTNGSNFEKLNTKTHDK